MNSKSADPSLHEIYRQRLLELFREPQSTGTIPEDAVKGWARNRTCGDEVSFFVKMEDDRVSSCHHETAGCAISTATASLLTKNLKGLTRGETLDLLRDVRRMVYDGGPTVETGELRILAAIHSLPARHECVGVAINAVESSLQQNSQSE